MPNLLQIYTPCPDLPVACQLLKTGQTVLYHAGDDGDLEVGVEHDYTILTTGQYAGTTNIVINAKTHALSNNCVIDNQTEKEWARYVPLGDIGPDNDGKLKWEDAVNGEDIWAFVQQANANSLGGHNDWRIPNYRELASILDLGCCSPTIDTTVFPSTPSTYCWTSSTYPCQINRAFSGYFTSGSMFYGTKATSKFYVRLVRN